MTLRRLRKVLWLGGSAMLAGAISVAMWTATAPLEIPVDVAAPAHAKQGTQLKPIETSVQELLTLAGRIYQGALFDPPPLAVVPANAPSLALRLTGTIIEPGRSLAMLVGADGKLLFRSVGQKAADAEVLSIEPQSVTVRYLGAPMQLKVEKARASP